MEGCHFPSWCEASGVASYGFWGSTNSHFLNVALVSVRHADCHAFGTQATGRANQWQMLFHGFYTKYIQHLQRLVKHLPNIVKQVTTIVKQRKFNCSCNKSLRSYMGHTKVYILQKSVYFTKKKYIY